MMRMSDVQESWAWLPPPSSSSSSSPLRSSSSLTTEGISVGSGEVSAHIIALRGMVNRTVSGSMSSFATADMSALDRRYLIKAWVFTNPSARLAAAQVANLNAVVECCAWQGLEPGQKTGRLVIDSVRVGHPAGKEDALE